MFLFVFFTASYVKNGNIEQGKLVTFAPDYGYMKGGRINVVIVGRNVTGTTFALLSQLQYHQNYSKLKEKDKFCGNISKIKDTQVYRCTSGFAACKWNATIQRKDIYYPVIYNCEDRRLDYQITYLNYQTYLDIRERFTPMIAMGISILYTILTMFWIYNIHSYQQFNIQLVNGFAFTCAFKAISVGILAYYWAEKSEKESIPFKFEVTVELFQIVSNGLIFMINVFATDGMSIIRGCQNFKDFLNKFILCNLFFLYRRLIHYTDSILLVVVYTFLCIIFYASYVNLVGRGTYVIQQIGDQFENDRQISLKYALAIKFNVIITQLLLFFVICISYAMLIEIRYTLLFLCEESLVIFVVYIDYAYFKIRKDFVPPEIQIEEAHEVIDPSGISYVEEPLANELAFVSNHESHQTA
ncbi:hypothetical protein TVAG_432880 [Trichomonas vaginalis G3]|uniref:Intimal thickness related receptor IRP domain-containing protein n=1 Tax=Trichomonas vaginalis (strain ATCC PRA-98 / G3) TaxID=412133 RepID=A2DIS9_TRIV3|nr:lung seven transmembrane receptor family [Trichomonas vaginalis G3]EAY19692.1 hypothetical protein TVAG_432880 [Trichomonas vaginalis G3]KAI5521288.1 lung seven transmembrane receptor family [Trichomonas vaginalis G3]|eukprot:XP_001580678.1 hypothetical protein [Trichomonas vaginalis G3]